MHREHNRPKRWNSAHGAGGEHRQHTAAPTQQSRAPDFALTSVPIANPGNEPSTEFLHANWRELGYLSDPTVGAPIAPRGTAPATRVDSLDIPALSGDLKGAQASPIVWLGAPPAWLKSDAGTPTLWIGSKPDPKLAAAIEASTQLPIPQRRAPNPKPVEPPPAPIVPSPTADWTSQTEWIIATTKHSPVPLITSYDTGSRPLNFLANKIVLPWRNLLASIENMPFEMFGELDEVMLSSPLRMEWQAAQVMFPLEDAMGLEVELPGALAYLKSALATNRRLQNVVRAPAYLFVGAGGIGGLSGVSKSTALNARFMSRSLAKILENPKHPLRFLVDPVNENWIARSHLSDEPTVQAGHLISKWTGAPEQFALEDSFLNQLTNWTGESGRRAFFEKEAVDVDGAIVEVESLARWSFEYPELRQFLSKPRIPGWTGK